MTAPTPARHLVPLGQVAKLILGMNVAREQKQGREQVRFVQVGDLDGETGHVASLSELNQGYIEPRGAFETARLTAGDLLVSCKGTIGKVALVSESSAGALPSTNLVIVRPGPELLPTTLLAIFRSRPVQEFMQSVSRGATIRSLSYRELEGFKVPIPDKSVQQALADLLQAHEESIHITREAMSHRADLVSGLTENALWA